MAGELQTVITAIPSASAASTTSAAISLKGVRKVTIFGTNTTNAHTYGVTVSSDGGTYSTFNRLVTNVTNTNAQNPVRSATFAPSANSTDFASMELGNDAFHSMKVVGTQVTAGSYLAKVVLEYYA